MTISQKNQNGPSLSYQTEIDAEAEQLHSKSVKLLDDVEHNLRAQQFGTVGHYDHDTPDAFAERVGEVYDKTAERVTQFAHRTTERAQSGAHATAEAVKAHPIMTAAVIGGLATAALAGASMFRSQRRDSQGDNFHPERDDLITAKPRKTVASKAVKRKSH